MESIIPIYKKKVMFKAALIIMVLNLCESYNETLEESNWVEIKTCVNDFRKEKGLDMLFIDLEKEYDRVPREIL